MAETATLEAGEAVHGVETTPHATTESTGHAEAAHEGGLPQFRFEYWGGQIVWLLLIFAILYVLLGRVFTPRLRRVIDERARTISEAVEQARLVQTEALEQARVAEAEVAEARIREARDAAMTNVGAIAADTAAAIVEKLTGRPAGTGEVEAALAAKGTR